MRVKHICSIIASVFIMSGCGDIQETNDNISVPMSATSETLSFAWIEYGFEGVLFPLQTAVGQSVEEINHYLGEPTKISYFDHGFSYHYPEGTVYINDQTDKSIALTTSLDEYKLSEEDLRLSLGTPDQVMKEEDGKLIYLYELDQFELIFETVPSNHQLKQAWLTYRDTKNRPFD